jgi:hypothetical protein
MAGVELGSGGEALGEAVADDEDVGCDERSIPQAAKTRAAIPPPTIPRNRRREIRLA